MQIRKNLIAGLLAWLPLAVSIGVIVWLVDVLDGVAYRLLGVVAWGFSPIFAQNLHAVAQIPGIGAVGVVLVLWLTGYLVNRVGSRWIGRLWNRLIQRIPVVKPIYSAVKKISDTLFSSNGQAFRKPMLVQYPRAGCWTIAFQTGAPSPAIAKHLPADCISVYVPTTPNPTSGFFLVLPRDQVIELDITVDEALTYVISMGAAAPHQSASEVSRRVAAADSM